VDDLKRIYIKDLMTGEMAPASDSDLLRLGYESTLSIPPLEKTFPPDLIVEVGYSLSDSVRKISLIKTVRNVLSEEYVYNHDLQKWVSPNIPLDHDQLRIKGKPLEYRAFGLKHIKLFSEGTQTIIIPQSLYLQILLSTKNTLVKGVSLDRVGVFTATPINEKDNLEKLTQWREEIMESLLEVDRLISHHLYS